ncbi:glycosyltransferase [Catellatospora tritici]|uniref:glycosyltransferase n=1 Tax=Catellatospora tritici TaxID=2851566 RepID=UPI0027E011F4|nr:glycosyltransferase [Catellatospora tritici]
MTAPEIHTQRELTVPAPRRHEPSQTGRAPLLVVVGTDVHPFDRLLDWTARWAEENGVPCVMQYGSSTPRDLPGSSAFFDHATLGVRLREAGLVVCHGGPATITEARRAGHIPVVVPRDPTRGEHVDDHQQRFAAHMGEAGMVRLCRTEDSLRAVLDAALAEPEALRLDTAQAGAESAAAVRRVGDLIDTLASAKARHADEEVRVLFIGGWGRSGSTLTDRLLGQAPDVCAVGEVTHTWERALRDNERCGCGVRFRDCDFWGRVGKVAYGGWDTLDVEQVLALKHRVDRMRFVARLALPFWATRRKNDLRTYGELHRKLYQAVAEVSGASVVVDSSKHASLAFALRHARGIDFRVLHLVRDGRAVAYSWSREVLRPEIVDAEVYMPTYSTVSSGLLWLVHNALFHLLDWVGTPVLRMRYEDFVAAPADSLRRIRGFSDLPTGKMDLLDRPAATADGLPTAQLAATHTVAGNPMRFTTGALTLRLDAAWRAKLAARKRRVLSLITWPLRARYGYLDWRKK